VIPGGWLDHHYIQLVHSVTMLSYSLVMTVRSLHTCDLLPACKSDADATHADHHPDHALHPAAAVRIREAELSGIDGVSEEAELLGIVL
jgi:hypothetical protein